MTKSGLITFRAASIHVLTHHWLIYRNVSLLKRVRILTKLSFLIVWLMKKTGLLEDLLCHKTRRKLRALGLLILFILFLLMILGGSDKH